MGFTSSPSYAHCINGIFRYTNPISWPSTVKDKDCHIRHGDSCDREIWVVIGLRGEFEALGRTARCSGVEHLHWLSRSCLLAKLRGLRLKTTSVLLSDTGSRTCYSNEMTII